MFLGVKDFGVYARWCKLVATASCVCRSFRSALLGPGADVLWPLAVLSATHPGLTSKQSQGLNRMLAAQGHRAFSVDLTGGGWDLYELRTVTASLTGLHSCMTLWKIHSPQEAAVISRTLAARPIKLVNYKGTAACVLPVTAQNVRLSVTSFEPPTVQGIIDQAALQRFVSCLRPLRDLRVLELHNTFWRLTDAEVQQWIVRHPQLEVLHLGLAAGNDIGRHDIESLHLLSEVELTLSLTSGAAGSLVPMLRQMQDLQLEALVVHAQGCTRAEETLLAKCSMKELFVLFLDPAKRLQRPPPGIPVTYRGLIDPGRVDDEEGPWG